MYVHTKKDNDMFNQCIYFNLSSLTRQITKIWQDEFVAVGLSPSHGYILFALANNPDASQKDLSEIMELDASTITRFVEALVAKKLIAKDKAGKGARYSLTAEGALLAKRVSGVMDGLLGHMSETFGAQQFDDFVGQLRRAKQIVKDIET